MTKFLTSLVLCVSILLPGTLFADEIVQFEDMPVEYTMGDNTYVGILVSEDEYKRMVDATRELQIDLALSQATLQAFQERYETQMFLKDQHIGILEKEVQRTDTWFYRHKGGIGLAIGFIAGAAVVTGITYAVNQPSPGL